MSKLLAGAMSQLYLIYAPLQLFGDFLLVKEQVFTFSNVVATFFNPMEYVLS
jgi:hypothetical protein